MKKLIFIFIAAFLLVSVAVRSQVYEKLTWPARFEIENISPVMIRETASGKWFADFGKDAFGTLIINIKATQPDTIIIRLGEKLAAPFTIDRNPGGSIRYQSVRLYVHPGQEEYILSLPPDRRNTNPPAVPLPPQFGVVLPFRYCEIENLRIPLVKEQLRQKAFFYHFNDDASSFTSSDTILNQIWDICKYSMKATSFCGLYIDGDRERIPYEGDALINQLSHYAVDSEYSLAARTAEYFMSHPTWPTEWILHTVILFYYDYLYTGNPFLLKKYYDALKVKTLIDLEREDGLITVKSPAHNDQLMERLGFSDKKQRLRDIVDWPPAQKDTGWKLATAEGERDGHEMVDVNTVVNAFHWYNLKLMSEIAGWLGKADDREFFRERSEKVRNSINTRLFDKARGVYTDGEGSVHSSIHSNMFPLAFGLVPEEHISSVTAFIRSRGMACSVYGAQHLLDGLYLAGDEEYALSLMTSTSDRSWWNMIRTGSTITLEAWDLKYKPNSDWNHAWGAAPANIITRRLWGIRPAEPGFSKAVINPQMGRLESSTIVSPTILGPIKAGYSYTKGTRSFSLEIPAGMETDFIIPEGDYRKIRLNGKRIRSPKDDVIKIFPGRSEIILEER